MESPLHPAVDSSHRIAGLDGLRALSILLVILIHTIQRRNLTHPVPYIAYVLGNGGMGVLIFFVISGYLITSMLLREHEKTGSISLKHFYIRRAFRILPPLYLYVLFIALLGLAGHLAGVTTREIVTALTLTRNYVRGVDLWAFEHFWTLCIEEQFYLLWPGLVVFCLARWPGAKGRRAAARVACIVIIVEPFIRVLSYHFLPNFHNPGMFHMQADIIMFGATGALLQGHQRFEKIYSRLTRWPWLLPLVLFFVLGALGMRFQNYWNMPIGFTLDGLVILMWLLWLTRNPHTLTGRIMNHSVVTWVGRLSYSLYIWQTFFLHYNNIPIFGGETWLNTFPGNWVCIFAVAVFSYYLVEQPALRLRRFFQAV
jgi:peptidoglycan/LPS O-acetylase OafA/YrhL